MFRVADWIADAIYSSGVTCVHGLMGGGAAVLNDGFIKHEKLQYICYHHEQAAGHAAIGESKYSGKISFVNPTTGCGGTNCITSVLNAWQDSVPVFFLSGTVNLETCSTFINQTSGLNLRTYGTQEHNITETVKSITKFSKFVDNPDELPSIFYEAVDLSQKGRPGPVWVDIPSDIQAYPAPRSKFEYSSDNRESENLDFAPACELLNSAERPIVLAGGGIRQSGCINEFINFIESQNIPIVTTYAARDYLPYDHRLNIGAVGIKGSRAGNFALQNADLLLILGCRLASSVIGYDPALFSPTSKKIMIDCDGNELRKNIINLDQKYEADLKKFFEAIK
ncbi:MAG: hypothetical protein CMF69_12325 [Magnetovibrio sp.]|nr:hypothetical protein [Magnetovibrio sp.]